MTDHNGRRRLQHAANEIVRITGPDPADKCFPVIVERCAWQECVIRIVPYIPDRCRAPHSVGIRVTTTHGCSVQYAVEITLRRQQLGEAERDLTMRSAQPQPNLSIISGVMSSSVHWRDSSLLSETGVRQNTRPPGKEPSLRIAGPGARHLSCGPPKFRLYSILRGSTIPLNGGGAIS